jgi:hypothetical protein
VISQSRTDPPRNTAAAFVESGLAVTHAPSAAPRRRKNSPVGPEFRMAHTRTVPSLLVERRLRPSGAKHTDLTQSRWPVRVTHGSGVSARSARFSQLADS